MGLKEWTKDFQTFVWGYGRWDGSGPTPHNSLLHCLLERGFIFTTIIFSFLAHQVTRLSSGMEPWVIGFITLGVFLHVSYWGMFWVLFLLILRFRYLRKGKDIREDFILEWGKKIYKNWRSNKTVTG